MAKKPSKQPDGATTGTVVFKNAAGAVVTPVLFETKMAAGVLQMFPLPNQRVKTAAGDVVDILPQYIAIRRNVEQQMTQEGEVWLTDEISPRAEHYVTGRFCKRVGYMSGVLEVKTGDEQTDLAISYYASFVANGGVSDVESEVVDEASKQQTNRVPLLQVLKSDKKLACPKIEDDGFYVDPEIWFYLLRNILRRKNTMLIGDTGTGKTELVAYATSKIGKPLQVFDMAISNPMTSLCGNQRINEKGVSEYQYARFARSLSGTNPANKKQNRGYLMLLDELSRAHPSANNVLLPLTDSRRTLYIENAMDSTEIKAHEETVFFATANIGMQFTGTNALDNALTNRFQPLSITHPPRDKEVQVLMLREKVARNEAQTLVEFATEVRADKNLIKKVSTRQLLEMAGLVYDGYTPAKAAEYVIINQYEEDEVDGGERKIIRGIIQKM